MAYPVGRKRSDIDIARKTVAARQRVLDTLPAKHAREVEELPLKHAARIAEAERVLAIAKRSLAHLEEQAAAPEGTRAVVIGSRR